MMYSLGGDRDAFCSIVTRYQSLLCSLAYSSVGDVKHSEDIAQETFVEAWKKLDTLRDPEKLKSWLCGILRFKVSHYRRSEQHQPLQHADDVQQHDSLAEDKTELDQQAIDQQQQSLLWKVLDGMEDNYREPLVLFYREEQSVEKVAVALDLSEDTVKQRLSRGRKLLKRAMSGFVEEALHKSKPGVAFTAGVLAAISGISPPAKAAALGAGAAKGGSSLSGVGMLSILAVLSGFISSFFGLRASLDQSRTRRERILAIKCISLYMLFAAIYVTGTLGCKYAALYHADSKGALTLIAIALMLAFAISYLLLTHRMFAAMHKLRKQERIFHPQAFSSAVDQSGAKQREYVSSWRLWGVPLVHFQFAMHEAGDPPAFGWIAGGSQARGLLFAWGGVTVAPVSVGIVSFGVISLGAVGFGVLSFGTVAVGLIGFGASAIAYKAYSSLSSLGWESAFSGGFAIAKDASIAPLAYATEINNQLAAEISNLNAFHLSYQWILAIVSFVVIVPAAWHAHQVRQRMKID